MEIVPCGHYVLIKVEEDETTARAKKAGIEMIEAHENKDKNMSDIGILQSVGESAYDRVGGMKGWGVEIGDKVLYAKAGGKKVDYDGFDRDKHGFLKLVSDEDIFAKVKE